MIDIEIIKLEIIKRLKPLNPEKIILFGSYAYGTPNQDSDIDLYVVTNDDFIPQNFKERMDVKLKISRAIKDLQKTIPIDTITHTKKMHEKFLNLNSSFSREILQNGVKLYG
jgi:predicted nucleotidyltransferase